MKRVCPLESLHRSKVDHFVPNWAWLTGFRLYLEVRRWGDAEEKWQGRWKVVLKGGRPCAWDALNLACLREWHGYDPGAGHVNTLKTRLHSWVHPRLLWGVFGRGKAWLRLENPREWIGTWGWMSVETAFVTWSWHGKECWLCSAGRSGLLGGMAEAGRTSKVPLQTAFGAGLSRAHCGRWWHPVLWVTPLSSHPGLSHNVLKRSACKPWALGAHNRHSNRENLREERRAESNSVLPPTLEAEDDKGSGREAILLWRENRTGLGNLEDGCWPSLRQLTLLTKWAP